MKSIGLLVLRLVVGGLLAGHGAQKLFGWFGGNGLEGTGDWLESLGLRPGKRWAQLAGTSEFGGGVLTALGALYPLGPLMTIGAMATATLKAHANKPIWVTEGGAELPVVNMAAASALVLAGPGALSIDRLFGMRIPKWMSLLFALAVAAGVSFAIRAPVIDEAGADAPEAAFQSDLDAPLDASLWPGDLPSSHTSGA